MGKVGYPTLSSLRRLLRCARQLEKIRLLLRIIVGLRTAVLTGGMSDIMYSVFHLGYIEQGLKGKGKRSLFVVEVVRSRIL